MTRAASVAGLAERLDRAIRAACTARGDDELCIALLITACGELDVQSRRDIAEHFEQVAREWGAWPPVSGSSCEGLSTGNSNRDHGLFTSAHKGGMS